jgi:hypothetical protein
MVIGCVFKNTIEFKLGMGVSAKYAENVGFDIVIRMESTGGSELFMTPEILTEMGV